MIPFKLFYEYLNDADMAMAEDFERRRKNERRRELRAVRRFLADMQFLYLVITIRRSAK